MINIEKNREINQKIREAEKRFFSNPNRIKKEEENPVSTSRNRSYGVFVPKEGQCHLVKDKKDCFFIFFMEGREDSVLCITKKNPAHGCAEELFKKIEWIKKIKNYK